MDGDSHKLLGVEHCQGVIQRYLTNLEKHRRPRLLVEWVRLHPDMNLRHFGSLFLIKRGSKTNQGKPRQGSFYSLFTAFTCSNRKSRCK